MINEIITVRMNAITPESFFIFSEFANHTKDSWAFIVDYFITPDQIQIIASHRDFADLARGFCEKHRFDLDIANSLVYTVKPLA